MRYRSRIYYTEEQKSQMWDRWQVGVVALIEALMLLSGRAHLP